MSHQHGLRGTYHSLSTDALVALELAPHKITVNAYAPGAILSTNIGESQGTNTRSRWLTGVPPVHNEEDAREDERLGLQPGTTTMKVDISCQFGLSHHLNIVAEVEHAHEHSDGTARRHC